MANPYTKEAGYIIAYETYLGDEYLVVLDRSKREPYSEDRAQNRWRVMHMPSRKTEDFEHKANATNRALKCSKSVHAHDQFWR